MKGRNFGTALLIGLLIATGQPSSAGFIGNKSGWDEMGEMKKLGYAMGLLDSWLGTYSSDLDANEYEADMSACIADLGLNSSHIVEIINTGYIELENWSEAPTYMLFLGARKTCLATINRYRRERGQEPLEPWE